MRVLKWNVTIDDEPHRIGGGPVVLVARQEGHPDYLDLAPRTVQVWTIEADEDVEARRQAQVYGTGMYVPEPIKPNDGWKNATHLGSCVDGQSIWHVFVVDDDRWHERPAFPKPMPC